MPKEEDGESKPGIDLAPLTGLIGPLLILLGVFGYIALGELGIGEIGRIAKAMETKPANTDPVSTPEPQSSAPVASLGNLNPELPPGIYPYEVSGEHVICGSLNSIKPPYESSQTRFDTSWQVWLAVKDIIVDEPASFYILKGDNPPEIRYLHGDARNQFDADGSRACFEAGTR